MSDCPGFETLLAYWVGELPSVDAGAFEEHYFGCASCTGRLEELAASADSVRSVFSAGRVGAFISPAFVERLREKGVRLREYRVSLNGSVDCSVAPEDEVLLSRLQAPLSGVERIDVLVLEGGSGRYEDVPFDPAAGEVVMAPAIAHVKTLPAFRQVVQLLAIGTGGERVIGEYTFNHRPHRGS